VFGSTGGEKKKEKGVTSFPGGKKERAARDHVGKKKPSHRSAEGKKKKRSPASFTAVRKSSVYVSKRNSDSRFSG